jgi:hypothetical protein
MDQMEDEIASMDLVALRPTGERLSVHVAIARPIQTSHGDWSCRGGGAPLVQFPRIGVHGVDSFQALALAVSMARVQLEHFVANGGRILFAGESSDEDISLDAVFGSRKQA